MDKGDIVELDGKEYICFDKAIENGTEYFYMISNFKPLEVRIVKSTQSENNGKKLEFVFEKEEKEKAWDLFKKSI